MTVLDPGTVAVVTGAAGGIGAAVVAAIAAEGVSVVCLDRDGADFARVLGTCADAGVRAVGIGVDVRDREAVRAAVARAGGLGRVRYGVNCAGIDHLQPSARTSPEDWDRVVDVNLGGVLNSCLAEREAMREGGSIVNVASVSASVFNRGAEPHAAYSASKAGVVSLSRVLAVEWVGDGVRVNSISPGYTRTEMTDRNPPERNAVLADQVPMGRMATVQEIAAPVVFLLGEGAAYVTGHDLRVDGGLTAW